MLQRGTARTVVDHRSHGPVRVQVFVVSVEMKTVKERRKLELGILDRCRCKLTLHLVFNKELPACRNIRNHQIRRLFNRYYLRSLH